ncbi:MAG: aminopeptidase [Gemmatimonadetes bacterium]|nr:aminopeptidase [Gemmatimonadota bacterium]
MVRLFGFLLILAFGSEIGYLYQLLKGQVALLWRAESIEKVLEAGKLSPDQRAKLELVQTIRAFAQREIGLNTSENYTTYVDIGRGPVSWNLVVCPKDRLEPLEWSYPVVGTVPYRGYFDRAKAEEARDRYVAEGYDTYLRPVGAYSTLGWFSDPVLSSMLRYSEGNLVDLIIHELTHATVWIEGDVTFNESLASFVGETGALMWLQRKYGTDSEVVRRVLDERADGVVFRKFMRDIASRLDSLYQSDSPQKITLRQQIFDFARTEFHTLPLKTELYARFPSWELNNARMALYRVYRERTDVFARVYLMCDSNLKATVGVLRQCASTEDPGLWLEEWLRKNQDKDSL